MSQSQTAVIKIYKSVIDDVITGVRDAFLDEGVDEQVLQELKQIWEQKLVSSKAVETNTDPPEPPQYLQKDIGRNNIPTKSGNIYPFQSHNSGHNAGQNANQHTHSVPQPQNQTQIPNNHSQTLQHQHQLQQHLQQQRQQQQQQHQQQQHQQQQHQQQQHHQQQLQQPLQQQQQQAHHQPPQQQQQQQQQQLQQHPTNSQPTPAQTVIVTDPNKQVPIQITLPAQAGGEARVLTIQVPASALQGNQLQQVLTGPVISATMALPLNLASSLLQQHVNAALQGQVTTALTLQSAAAAQQTNSNPLLQNQSNSIRQLDGMDGLTDTSDEEEEEEDEEDIDDDEENEEKDDDENEDENAEGQEEEPLNSGDDVSDEDPTDLFDTDNVVVCQYDKITRSRNKWKFYLKDGIMNLNGKDYVFQKAGGDAEW